MCQLARLTPDRFGEIFIYFYFLLVNLVISFFFTFANRAQNPRFPSKIVKIDGRIVIIRRRRDLLSKHHIPVERLAILTFH
jgi:hypothetical protein